jgi:ribosomal protein S18 acetylase RimI-like enzyme
VGITYKINNAKLEKIIEHLTVCNSHFIPPLSSKVSIEDYAKKLLINAERYEAWMFDRLVGLVAVYMNNPMKEKAFITNVSVLPDCTGRGIAANLINESISKTRAEGFGKIMLEVSNSNFAAINLYKKLNFEIIWQDKSDTLKMLKYL